MKTTSTAQAMAVLGGNRRELIDYARYVATVLCKAQGSVHSRQVRDVLERAGMLRADSKELWLGAVFNGAECFEWTGAFHAYSDSARNIHERTIKVWRLREGSPGHPRPAGAPPFVAKPLNQLVLF